MTFMKKQAAMIAICAALLMCVAAAGCTSATSSSTNSSATANPSSQAATATPTPTATATPTATPTASPSGGATSLTVLFFYSPTCPHCEAIEGQVQQIPTYGGKVSVQWVDTTTQSGYNELHSYGATEVPTFVILNGGSEVGSPLVGLTSTDQLNAQISSLLS
jgi:protein-disulfide isomerase